jgi:O-antigen biosynthesis protein
LLHTRMPEVPIHTFGIVAHKLPFPATVHAHLAPAQLNALYNECGAGLALSFTNISLIGNELLAAGVVPVVNDYPGTRADLTNPHVSWTRATPDAIARSLADALEYQREVGPDALRKSVESLTWAPAQSAVVHAIENECARVSHSSNPMERS